MPTCRVTQSNDGRTQKGVLYHNVNVHMTAKDLTLGLLTHLVGNSTDPFAQCSDETEFRTKIADTYRGFCYLIEKIVSGEMITGKAPLIVHIVLRYLRAGRKISDGVNALTLVPRCVYISSKQVGEEGIDPKYSNFPGLFLIPLGFPDNATAQERMDTLAPFWKPLVALMAKCGRVLFDVSTIKSSDASQFLVTIEEKKYGHLPRSTDDHKAKVKNKMAKYHKLVHAELGNSLGPFTIPMDVGGYFSFLCLGSKSNSSSETGLAHCGWGLPVSAVDYMTRDSVISSDLYESNLQWTLQSSHPVDARFAQALTEAGGANTDVANLVTGFTRTPGQAIMCRGFSGVGVLTCSKFSFPVLNIADLHARQMYFSHFQRTRTVGGSTAGGYEDAHFYPHTLRLVATSAITSGDLSFYNAYRESPNYKNIGIDVEACTLRSGIRTSAENGTRAMTIPIIDDGETSESINKDGKFFKATVFPAIIDPSGEIDTSYVYNADLFPKGYIPGPTLGGFFGALGLVYDEYSLLNADKGYVPDATSSPAPAAAPYTRAGTNVRSIIARLNFKWTDAVSSLPASSYEKINMATNLYWMNCNNGKLAVPTTDGRVGALNMTYINRVVSVTPGPSVSSQLVGTGKITCQLVRGDAVLMETPLFNKEHTHCAARFFNSCFLSYAYYPKELTQHTASSLSYRHYLNADDAGEWTPIRGATCALTTVTAKADNPPAGVFLSFVDSTSRDFGGPGDSFLNNVESRGAGLGTGIFATAINWIKRFRSNHRGQIAATASFVAKRNEPTDYNSLKNGQSVVSIKDMY